MARCWDCICPFFHQQSGAGPWLLKLCNTWIRAQWSPWCWWSQWTAQSWQGSGRPSARYQGDREVSTFFSWIIWEHPRQHYSFKTEPQTQIMGSQRGSSTLTTCPRRQARSTCVLQQNELWKEWCQTLPGKPCLWTCCSSRVKSATDSKTWKPHSLCLGFRGITKKCMQRNVCKTQIPHLFFLIFSPTVRR